MQERQNVKCNSLLHILNDRLKGVLACGVRCVPVAGQAAEEECEKKGKRGTAVYG